MLNEIALRTPGFVEGVRITLHDGQAWAFPKPKILEVSLDFSGPGRPRFASSAPVRSFGVGYFEKLEAALASEEPLDQIQQFAWLASDILRLNYGLSDEDLSDLLPYVVDEVSGEWEPSNRAMWQSIVNVAAGIAGVAGRTRVRWARLAAIMACGRPDGGLDLEDANDIAAIMVGQGTFPAANTWVEREAAAAEDERMAAMFDGLL
jgi:hypothetical protein